MEKTFTVWRLKNMLNAPKRCTRCKQSKALSEYYVCLDRPRSECKECTLKHQKERKDNGLLWKQREENKDTVRLYSREYYQGHKEEYKGYRVAFNERHPDYYKNYRKKDIQITETVGKDICRNYGK